MIQHSRPPATRKGEVTRFAPSPTGYLHLGHAFSALAAYRTRGRGGSFLLRIEDIDPARCRDEFIGAIFEDLRWLGLGWEKPVRRQSEHPDDYRRALRRLGGLTYPCFCTRAEIKAEIARAGHAPHGSPGNLDSPVYPGLCRDLSARQRDRRIAGGQPSAKRLDSAAAIARTGPLDWFEAGRGNGKGEIIQARPERFGDAVLARKEAPTSYHLAVTVDDHLQGITRVTRGADLSPATDLHRLLQELLGYRPPTYHHHPLITDDAGRRLAKRDRDMTIRGLRESGYSARAVIAMAEARAR